MTHYQAQGATPPLHPRLASARSPWQDGIGWRDGNRAAGGPGKNPRDRQDSTAIAQAQAILALAREVAQLRTALAEVQAALAAVYEELDVIGRAPGPPRRR